MKICYLDTFCPEHSGRFWLKAFQEHGEVRTYEVGGLRSVSNVLKDIVAFNPEHIHFGSSTQSEKTFKLTDIGWLKKKTDAVISFFYGDGYYRPYFYELAEIVDKIFVTNKNLCWKPNIHYTLCPAPKEMAVDLAVRPEKYNLVFIGNNYNPIRRKCIYAINRFYPLTVFGNGWKKRKIDTKGPINYEDYPKVCQSSKIVLGDPAGPICFYSGRRCGVGNPDRVHTPGYCRAYQCSKYTELEGYVSNRVSNILISGGVCLTPYVKGLENAVVNSLHLWWYEDWNEFEVLVKRLITEDTQHIREAGREFALENYTFEAIVQRILYEDSTSSTTKETNSR
jgi:hypothetical protein